LSVSLVMPMQALAVEPKPISIKVDGAAVDLPDAKPFIDPATSRTMVPIRFISEKLGAKVEWDESIQTVKIDRNGKQITLKIGEKVYKWGDRRFGIDAPAVIKDDRTFVPLRAVSQAFEVYVKWDSAQRLVIVDQNPVIKNVTGKDFPVNEKDATFQAFHQSLAIKDGVLTGKVPKKNLYINFSVYFKDGHSSITDVFGPGESFSLKVADIKLMGITVIDQAKKVELASYTYRTLPDLLAERRVGGK
ncbi:copper amine oxidase N-terminal domain-containing protein, partial [Brevibacillus formosus]|uniref:copper amine oxidase N-terminal domain-containing protein n=2 Tax=Brevibacillus TaxID=55080 RepID=UPI002E1E5D63|nr:copper amine oxidase N-terminal domain-containing protein [Brevibacillus formosus]